MQFLTLLGWVVGVIVAAIFGIPALVVFGIPIAALLSALAGTVLAALAGVIGALGTIAPGLTGFLSAALAGFSLIGVIIIALISIALAYAIFYLIAYAIATAALSPQLTTLLNPPPVFPASTNFYPTAPTTVPDAAGEYLARGFMIGFNATVNFLLILLLILVTNPVWTTIVASFAFVVISLVAVLPVARNRFFQGLLGWSSWLFPISYIATFFGLILFTVNTIASWISKSTPFSVELDFTTGVVETYAGAINPITLKLTNGFSLGNFTFLNTHTSIPARFTTPSISPHETGHSLNTAAFGGVVLWINAIDENIWPIRNNLAYGELMAQSHSRAMPGTAEIDYSIRMWF